MAEVKKTVAKKTTSTKTKVEVKTQKDVKVTKVESKVKLPKSVFGLEWKESYSQSIFDVIIAERASRRQGTHKVKNRGEVSGTGKKPWRQKGTGRARTGSLRTPVFVGGGRAFGPTVERNYNLKVNKKVRLLALTAALTQLAQNKQVLVEELKLEKISTKSLVSKLTEFKANDLRNVLIVTSDEQVYLSGRNLKNVSIVKVSSISVEQLIRTDLLIIGSKDIEYLEGLVK